MGENGRNQNSKCNRGRKITMALLLAAGMSLTGIPAGVSAAEVTVQTNDAVSVSQLTEGENVKVEYPVLSENAGYDTEIIRSVNQYFYDEAVSEAQAAIQQFDELKADFEEYGEEELPTMVSETTCESIYLQENIYSVMRLHYSYSGGAHGYAYSDGISFDLTTGKQLSMSELLGCDEQVMREAVVSAYWQNIIGQVENITEQMIRDSFDLMYYWMAEDGMHVSIPAYGIASYAAGPQEVIVTQDMVEAAASKATDGDSWTITVVGGIEAPASDFILPQSSSRELGWEDLTVLEGNTVEEEHYRSQLAINEILARYGYVFSAEQGGSAKEAYDQFEGKSWYEAAKPYCPSTSANEMLYTYITDLELSNIDLICEWQKEHNCYY